MDLFEQENIIIYLSSALLGISVFQIIVITSFKLSVSQSISQYLLSTYWMPVTVLQQYSNTIVEKKWSLAFNKLKLQWEKKHIKTSIKS